VYSSPPVSEMHNQEDEFSFTKSAQTKEGDIRTIFKDYIRKRHQQEFSTLFCDGWIIALHTKWLENVDPIDLTCLFEGSSFGENNIGIVQVDLLSPAPNLTPAFPRQFVNKGDKRTIINAQASQFLRHAIVLHGGQHVDKMDNVVPGCSKFMDDVWTACKREAPAEENVGKRSDGSSDTDPVLLLEKNIDINQNHVCQLNQTQQLFKSCFNELFCKSDTVWNDYVMFLVLNTKAAIDYCKQSLGKTELYLSHTTTPKEVQVENEFLHSYISDSDNLNDMKKNLPAYVVPIQSSSSDKIDKNLLKSSSCKLENFHKSLSELLLLNEESGSVKLEQMSEFRDVLLSSLMNEQYFPHRMKKGSTLLDYLDEIEAFTVGQEINTSMNGADKCPPSVHCAGLAVAGLEQNGLTLSGLNYLRTFSPEFLKDDKGNDRTDRISGDLPSQREAFVKNVQRRVQNFIKIGAENLDETAIKRAEGMKYAQESLLILLSERNHIFNADCILNEAEYEEYRKACTKYFYPSAGTQGSEKKSLKQLKNYMVIGGTVREVTGSSSLVKPSDRSARNGVHTEQPNLYKSKYYPRSILYAILSRCMFSPNLMKIWYALNAKFILQTKDLKDKLVNFDFLKKKKNDEDTRFLQHPYVSDDSQLCPVCKHTPFYSQKNSVETYCQCFAILAVKILVSAQPKIDAGTIKTTYDNLHIPISKPVKNYSFGVTIPAKENQFESGPLGRLTVSTEGLSKRADTSGTNFNDGGDGSSQHKEKPGGKYGKKDRVHINMLTSKIYQELGASLNIFKHFTQTETDFIPSNLSSSPLFNSVSCTPMGKKITKEEMASLDPSGEEIGHRNTIYDVAFKTDSLNLTKNLTDVILDNMYELCEEETNSSNGQDNASSGKRKSSDEAKEEPQRKKPSNRTALYGSILATMFEMMKIVDGSEGDKKAALEKFLADGENSYAEIARKISECKRNNNMYYHEFLKVLNTVKRIGFSGTLDRHLTLKSLEQIVTVVRAVLTHTSNELNCSLSAIDDEFHKIVHTEAPRRTMPCSLSLGVSGDSTLHKRCNRLVVYVLLMHADRMRRECSDEEVPLVRSSILNSLAVSKNPPSSLPVNSQINSPVPVLVNNQKLAFENTEGNMCNISYHLQCSLKIRAKLVSLTDPKRFSDSKKKSTGISSAKKARDFDHDIVGSSDNYSAILMQTMSGTDQLFTPEFMTTKKDFGENICLKSCAELYKMLCRKSLRFMNFGATKAVSEAGRDTIVPVLMDYFDITTKTNKGGDRSGVLCCVGEGIYKLLTDPLDRIRQMVSLVCEVLVCKGFAIKKVLNEIQNTHQRLHNAMENIAKGNRCGLLYGLYQVLLASEIYSPAFSDLTQREIPYYIAFSMANALLRLPLVGRGTSAKNSPLPATAEQIRPANLVSLFYLAGGTHLRRLETTIPFHRFGGAHITAEMNISSYTAIITNRSNQSTNVPVINLEVHTPKFRNLTDDENTLKESRACNYSPHDDHQYMLCTPTIVPVLRILEEKNIKIDLCDESNLFLLLKLIKKSPNQFHAYADRLFEKFRQPLMTMLEVDSNSDLSEHIQQKHVEHVSQIMYSTNNTVNAIDISTFICGPLYEYIKQGYKKCYENIEEDEWDEFEEDEENMHNEEVGIAESAEKVEDQESGVGSATVLGGLKNTLTDEELAGLKTKWLRYQELNEKDNLSVEEETEHAALDTIVFPQSFYS